MAEKVRVGTIDLTPTWTEILPVWKRIAETAYSQVLSTGTNTLPPNADPEGNLERFWQQMAVMAEAADKWNAYCKEKNSEGTDVPSS